MDWQENIMIQVVKPTGGTKIAFFKLLHGYTTAVATLTRSATSSKIIEGIYKLNHKGISYSIFSLIKIKVYSNGAKITNDLLSCWI